MGGDEMKMERIVVQLPKRLKGKLDEVRQRGTSTAGLIRHLLEQYFKGKKAA
jgi:metal-responsive CopG/Arc/MetJ family transcriptional regulator